MRQGLQDGFVKNCFLIALPVVAALCGCGANTDGPVRYAVSGNVTFDGQAVPKGFVTFLPDVSKGNKGPGGGAEIKDGRYRTARGKGVVGGPYVVKIVGYDGVPTMAEGEELTDGSSLFDPYQTTVEFPQEETTQDFQVPSAD